jgi:hypothetical protein
MKNLVADAKDFGSLGDYGDLAKIPDGEIPTYYYDFLRTNLPMTDAEYEAAFAPTVSLFSERAADANRQTNTATGTSVNEPFVACGIGVLAMGEGEAFSVPGVSLVTPAGGFPAGTETPAVPTREYLGCFYCGSASFTASPGTGQHAVLWWGAPTWRFIEKFFQAYRLQLAIARRFLLVDESLFDVGMSPVPPEFIGASESLYPTMPFIRAVNGVMQDKGILQAFLPPNVFVTTSLTQNDSSLPAPIVPVTYGHPRICGLANRVYNFRQPIVFLPGMRFTIDFVQVVAESTFPELRNTVTANCLTLAENLTQFVDINDVPTSTGSTCTIPGGQISLGVVLKGLALQPQACAQYLTNFVPRDSICERMYRECGLGVAPFVQEMLAREKTGRLQGWLQGR